MSPSRKAELARLGAFPFAHRGLHGSGRIENSRAAFEAAIARGSGIELDVQLSRDGHAIVFHDYKLDRLTAQSGPVAERTAAELSEVTLSGTRETIPSLPEILALIGSRVPVLIELKARGRHDAAALSLAVFRALDGYRGPAGAMSFNPEVGRWFARHGERVLRGLVVTEAGRRWRGAAERWLAYWRAKPEFLAYDVRDLPSRFGAAAKQRGLPVYAWTCRDPAATERAWIHADQIIYEQSE